MIQNRELTLDDYLEILRRRMWIILIPGLIAPALGFGMSYLFSPKYTSTSTVLVEEQKVPQGYVKPVVTEDLMQRVTTLEQQILSRNRLLAVVERMGLAKDGNVDDLMGEIRKSVEIRPVEPTTGTGRRKGDVPGFNVNYTGTNARVAQQICTEVTVMLLEENLKSREQVARGTTEFLARQVEEAKRSLDDQDAKMAAFKRQYAGQLPDEADNNMKILMGLNSQLDAVSQTANRAQQDKSYAESLVAQQLAAWKASSSTTSPQALQQQLSALQNQLTELEAKYTPEHPDVVKARADVAALQKKQNEVNAAKPDPAVDKATSAAEPPEVRQLRVQIHQYEDTIAQATQNQKRLQEQIKIYQGRVSLSPGIEEQYKQLTRDYDMAQKFYNDLLVKKSDSEMTTDMERQQQGEQFHLLNPASLPTTPSFPNRLLFAGGGLGAGLALGLGLAMWLELNDKAIRNESDVEAVMALPMLVSLPWLGQAAQNKDSKKKPDRRSKQLESEKETVEV